MHLGYSHDKDQTINLATEWLPCCFDTVKDFLLPAAFRDLSMTLTIKGLKDPILL